MRDRIFAGLCLFIGILVMSCSTQDAANNRSTSPSPSGRSSTSSASPQMATSSSLPSEQDLRITSPSDNEQVGELPIVEGVVREPTAKVWVIVHPMEIATRWVQPLITVREDGKWRVQIHVGRPGTVDVGKHFEIMAVANPKKKIKEGDESPDWPEAKSKSQVIEVVRK